MKPIDSKTVPAFLLWFMAMLLVVSSLFATSAIAAVKRLAVIPFQINAEKDLSYLKQGIVDMLGSRLAHEETLVVIGKEETAKVLESVSGPLNIKTARNIATQLGADYIIFGSLTLFGQNVSLDAQLADVSGIKQPFHFSRQGKGVDSIIPSIDEFAALINENVFGRKTNTTLQRKSSSASSSQTLDARTHPEKLFESGAMDDDQKKGGGLMGAPNPSFISGSPRRSGRSFWKGKNFKQLIVGIAIADTDKDGRQETIVVSDQSVEVYRFEQKRFFRVAEIHKTNQDHFIGVDVADVNQNGYPEIFVTALTADLSLGASFVLEYNGSGYAKIVDRTRWYFRVAKTDGLPMLFGQRQSAGQNPYSKRLAELTWQGGEYVPSRTIRLKEPANLLGFIAGDISNDKSETFVAYTDYDRLVVSDASGRNNWKSEDVHGGSMTYFMMDKEEPDQLENRKYLPVRLLLVDLDNDGTLEIITARNNEMSKRKLQSFRRFSSGYIESLSWDRIGMNANWKTPKMAGRISDFAIGDFDNDGQLELMATIVLVEGDVIGTRPKSTIIAYNLK